MRISPVTLGLAAVLLSSVPLPSARAELIPWMYNWSRDPFEVHADAPGTGYVTLTDEAQKTAVGDSDIVATNIKAYSTATKANPDVFTNRPYSLTLTIRDLDSGLTGSMTFTGVINGQLTAQSANLQNTFTGAITQTIHLGQHSYTATIGPYTPPGPPGAVNSGSISGHTIISIQPVLAMPEPGTLTLTGLGLTLLLARRRFRLRLPQVRVAP